MKKENTRYLPTVFTGIALLLSIGCCLLCGGCSNEAGRPEEPGSVPLRVESLRLDAGVTTRTGGTPVTTDGATIRVFLTGEGGYTPVCGKIYSYASGAWGSTDPIYVDGRQGKVVAVYDPKNVVTFAAGSSVSNEPLQAQAYDGNKLWYYDNTSGEGVRYNNSTMAFSMKCAYARLKFKISRNANYPVVCKVSRIVIRPSSGDFHASARVDIADGSLTGTPVANYTIDTSLLPMNTTGIAVGSVDTSIDYLFPAQKLEAGAGLTFRLSVDGAEYLVTVPGPTFNEIKAGVQYTVELEMSAQGMAVIRITSVTTEDWVDGVNTGPLIPLP